MDQSAHIIQADPANIIIAPSISSNIITKGSCDQNLTEQAHHLLQQLQHWSYYTIWRHNNLGFTWSDGDANRALIASHASYQPEVDACDEYSGSKVYYLALRLQQFYKQIIFHPLHLGTICGDTILGGGQKWASGPELSKQLCLLSKYNHLPIPAELLQFPLFIKTVACIPLGKGRAILEIGSQEIMVPETHDGVTRETLMQDKTLLNSPSNQQPVIWHDQHDTSELQAGKAGIARASISSPNNYSSSPSEAGLTCSPTAAEKGHTDSPNYSGTEDTHNKAGTVTSVLEKYMAMTSLTSASPPIMASMESLYAPAEPSMNNLCNFDQSHNIIGPNMLSNPTMYPALNRLITNLAEDSQHYEEPYHRATSMFSSMDHEPYHATTTYNLPKANEDLYEGDNNQMVFGLPGPSQTCLPALVPAPTLPSTTFLVPEPTVWPSIDMSINDLEMLRSPLNPTAMGAHEVQVRPIMENSVLTSTYEQGRAFRHWGKSIAHTKPRRRPRDSLLKRILLRFLPALKRMSENTSVSIHGSVADRLQLHNERLLQLLGSNTAAASQYGTSDDNPFDHNKMDMAKMDSVIGSIKEQYFCKSGAVQHMYAERNRRREQTNCFKELRNLVPGILKKDKVATLRQTLKHIENLHEIVQHLVMENSLLGQNTLNKIATLQRDFVLGMPSQSENNMSAPPTYEFVTSLKEEQRPGFYFEVSPNTLLANPNGVIKDIIDRLEERELQCTMFHYDVLQNGVNIKIFAAILKDGKSHILDQDYIHRIKEWWMHFSSTLI